MSPNDYAATEALRLCLAGALSPEVALARLVLAGLPPDDVAARVASLPRDDPRGAALFHLHARNRDGLEEVRAMLVAARLDHDEAPVTAGESVAQIAAAYDRAVARAPEASVAAYSLNDPAILAAATAEIVSWLAGEGLIGPDRDVLDLGCGIGRVASALAPRCRSVLGLDVSAGMVAEARRRHGAMPGLRFALTGGRDLAALPSASLDLVLAADSFPYLVQAGEGVADRHVADAARVLRPGGALVILNLSYGRDAESDRADAAGWAGSHAMRVTLDGGQPFALWDATAFVLRR